MLPGYALLPQRWTGFPSIIDTYIQRNKKLCALSRTRPTLFPHVTSESSGLHALVVRKDGSHPRSFPYFPTTFAKSCPFSGKVVLFFHALLAPLSFPPGLLNEMGHFPTLRTAFYRRLTFFPLLTTTYRREQLTFLVLSICDTKQNSSNSSEDELLLFEFRNI